MARFIHLFGSISVCIGIKQDRIKCSIASGRHFSPISADFVCSIIIALSNTNVHLYLGKTRLACQGAGKALRFDEDEYDGAT